MTIPLTIEALQERVTELEAELVRLRPIEEAAREAHAFFAGRRPGFPPTYPRDIICAAFEPNPPPGHRRRPAPARSSKRRKHP